MPRTVPSALATHLAGPQTICYLLKITPKVVSPFGITSLDADVVYDDGNGAMTYYAKSGYTPMDIDTHSDLSVDNTQQTGLVAQYSVGMTTDGVARGDYDGAAFIQYMVNYVDLTMGHTIINAGTIGQVKIVDGVAVMTELRSPIDVLKQNSMIEVTSITDRARLGDERNKLPLRWYATSVATVGAEADRTFTLAVDPGTGTPPGDPSGVGTVSDVPFFTGDGTTKTAQLLDTSGAILTSGFTVSTISVDGSALDGSDWSVDTAGIVTFVTAPASAAACTWAGTIVLRPDGFFAPGVVHFTSGANDNRESEVESYDAATGTVTLLIPMGSDIAVGDTLNIRQDYDGSWEMAKALGCELNFRGEPFIPRANGTDLQSASTNI